MSINFYLSKISDEISSLRTDVSDLKKELKKLIENHLEPQQKRDTESINQKSSDL